MNTAYVEGTYHRRPHSSLSGQSPMDRFLQDQELLRFLDHARLGRAFLHELKRRVSKDATISLGHVVYEVPQIYCGQQVDLLFSPHEATHVYLKPPHQDQLLRIEPVRAVDNSRIPRKQNHPEPLDYTQLYQDNP